MFAITGKKKSFNGFNIDEMRKLYSELDEIYLNFIKVNCDEKLLENCISSKDGQMESTFLHSQIGSRKHYKYK